MAEPKLSGEGASFVRLGHRDRSGRLIDDQDDLDVSDFGGSMPLPGERFVRRYRHPDGSPYYEAFKVVERIYCLGVPGTCATRLVAEETELTEDEEVALALPRKDGTLLADEHYEPEDHPD